MASDRAIAASFATLLGAGLPFPKDEEVAAALPMGWRVTLSDVDDERLCAAVDAYLHARPRPIYWPKAVEIATLADGMALGRVASRPDFATLRRAYFEARSHGETDIAARLPPEVRDAIVSKLEAAGGMAALRRAMMAQGSYELSSLERLFNAAPAAALVRRKP